MVKKIGFLFGAGAEIGYGMPTGGTFALDIFRQDPTEAKKEFKKMRAAIDKTTAYAGTWLPENFDEKNIGSFGKSVFSNIIKSTIEHNREDIINKLNNFDELAQNVLEKVNEKNNVDVCSSIKEITGRNIDDINMTATYSFTDEFSKGNRLFSSHFFSALLLIYKARKDSSDKIYRELGKIIVSIMQLQVGALSEDLTKKINDNPFRKKDDDIDLFDDLGEFINLNYSLAGVTGLEYLLEKRSDITIEKGDNDRIVILFAQKLLEAIFSEVIDYKSLIDSNWHYLYCPRSEWNKFCKICIFLFTVRNYIEKQCNHIDYNEVGYYDDVNSYIRTNKIQVDSIATTNYTSLIKKKIVAGPKIYFLNGSIDLWYNPYINHIETREVSVDKTEWKYFEVPLLFTQSGTKPMTSIYMSKQYVEVYYSFFKADVICVVGFGFNTDDEHINGILRELINDGKKIVIVTNKRNQTESSLKEEYIKRLRVSKSDSIQIVTVDKDRKDNGQLWLDKLYEIMGEKEWMN